MKAIKSPRIATLLCALIAWLAATVARPIEAQTAIEATRTNNQIQVHLGWPAEADRQYEVHTSTNLAAGGWWLATTNPIAPTNLIGEFWTTATNRTQFFRVAARDTQGPVITVRYPATNGIGVGRFATLTVMLGDETGVDTNRVALTWNGLTLTNGCPGVTITTNWFHYDPGTNAWGDYGATSVVSFVCADLLGNSTLSWWTFTLEVQPVVTNVLIHLPPPAAGKGTALAKAAKEHGASFAEGLTLVSFETNLIVFSYSGTDHGLYTGGILVSRSVLLSRIPR